MKLSQALLIVLVLMNGITSYGLEISAESVGKIEVTGDCEVDVIPDEVSLTFMVKSRKPTSDAAYNEATQKHEKLRNALKSMKIDNADIETQEASLQEIKEWENQKTVSKGFESRYRLSVRMTDWKKAGELMKVANSAGVDEISGPNPMVSRRLKAEKQNECLEHAVAHSKMRADRMAKVAGVKIQQLGFLTTESCHSGSPVNSEAMPRMMMKSASADGSAPDIVPGSQTIRMQVCARYWIKN